MKSETSSDTLVWKLSGNEGEIFVGNIPRLEWR